MPVPCTLPIFTVSFYRNALQEDEIFMARFLHQDFLPRDHRRNHWILAFFWVAGLAFGTFSAFAAGPSLFLMMRGAAHGSLSIVSLLATLYLPFLLSAFAVFLSAYWLIFPLSFAKGFLFAFVSAGIVGAFGSAGWLFRLFLCFADHLSAPVLYWFWMYCLNNQSGIRLQFLLTGSCLFLIASTEYSVISPFLADLMIL